MIANRLECKGHLPDGDGTCRPQPKRRGPKVTVGATEKAAVVFYTGTKARIAAAAKAEGISSLEWIRRAVAKSLAAVGLTLVLALTACGPGAAPDLCEGVKCGAELICRPLDGRCVLVTHNQMATGGGQAGAGGGEAAGGGQAQGGGAEALGGGAGATGGGSPGTGGGQAVVDAGVDGGVVPTPDAGQDAGTRPPDAGVDAGLPTNCGHRGEACCPGFACQPGVPVLTCLTLSEFVPSVCEVCMVAGNVTSCDFCGGAGEACCARPDPRGGVLPGCKAGRMASMASGACVCQ